MPPMPLMPMSRCCSCFRAFSAAVRGILFLTLLEAACAFGYSIYIVVIVSSYETDSREEYFGAGFLSILAAALLLFVATAVQRENSYELAAANLISMSLCLGPLLILFKQPDRAGKAGLIAEVTARVDSSLRVAFAVIAACFGACFAGASVLVQQEFAWKIFLVYGEAPERRTLSRRLQRWACLWKVDAVFSVLCLLAVWAFLFKGWSNLQVVGGCVALLSSLSCSAALYWAVHRERRRLTLALQLLAALQPIYLVYKAVDIILQELVLDSDEYLYAWPSVMLPSFLLACLVRVLLILSSLSLVRTVFGHGLKGKDPFADDDELGLPRVLRRRLRHRSDLRDALRLCMRGQQLRCSSVPSGSAGASAGAAGAARGAAEAAREVDLRTSFVQLCTGDSGELEHLSLPWLGATVALAHLLHVQSHGAAGSSPSRNALPVGELPQPQQPQQKAPQQQQQQQQPQPNGATPLAEAELAPDSLSFTLWYLDGEQPRQMRFVTHDEHSLWCWVQGLRAALPPRSLDPP